MTDLPELDIPWETGQGRWRYPNQTCGVAGSPDDIYERSRDGAKRVCADRIARANAQCTAAESTTLYYNRERLAAYLDERAALVNAADEYEANLKRAGITDSGGLLSLARERAVQDDDAIQECAKLVQWYEERASSGMSGHAVRGRRTGGGPLGHLPLPMLYAMLAACVAGIVLLSMGGH